MAVNSAWKSFNDYIHKGEPSLRQWLLLGNITSPLLIATLYVLFVKVIGPALMKNRKPFNLRHIMPPYNFGLVVFYVYFLLKGFTFLPEMGIRCICGSLDLKMGPIVEKFFTLGWQLYIVKYVELLDTIFLVLSKKFNMITTLHVTHHALVPVFGFMGFRSETSGYLSVFMMLNSFIHVIMYTYYGIAALGPKYQKYIWWKKYLTLLQIAQFVAMSIYMTVMSYIGCTTSRATLYFGNTITLGFCALFMNYYKRVFVDRPKKEQYKNGIPKLPNTSAMNGVSKHTKCNGSNNRKRKK